MRRAAGIVIVAALLIATAASVRASLKGHVSMVNSVAFSADGKTVLSGSWDWTMRLWNLSTGGRWRYPTTESSRRFLLTGRSCPRAQAR